MDEALVLYQRWHEGLYEPRLQHGVGAQASSLIWSEDYGFSRPCNPRLRLTALVPRIGNLTTVASTDLRN